MEGRKELFIILGIAILLLISSLVFYFAKTSSTEPTLSSLEKCNSISYSGEGAINIVFLSTEKQAKEYSSFLLKTSPFDETSNAFNIYQINYKPKCEIYKGIAVLCNSKDVVKMAASCPNDYTIVLDKQSPVIRSSSYQNIMSLNSAHSLNVLIHEFGHAFANFAEEYTPASIPRGSENCKSSCKNFDSETNGCFKGCSKTNYYRSIENGVMRTLSTSEYGIYDKSLIRKLIGKYLELSPLTGKATAQINSCLSQKYAFLEIQNQEGKPKVINKQILSGCAPDYNSPQGSMNYKIYNNQGNLISEKDTNIMIFTDVQPPKENQIIGETYIGGIDNSFILTTQLTSETKRITITNKNTGNSISEDLQDFGGETACQI